MIAGVTIAHGALNYFSSSRIEKEKFFVSILRKLVSNTDAINDSFVFIFFFSGTNFKVFNNRRETKRELLRDSTNIETKNKAQTIERY